MDSSCMVLAKTCMVYGETSYGFIGGNLYALFYH